jgi:hypothetical protein
LTSAEPQRNMTFQPGVCCAVLDCKATPIYMRSHAQLCTAMHSLAQPCTALSNQKMYMYTLSLQSLSFTHPLHLSTTFFSSSQPNSTMAKTKQASLFPSHLPCHFSHLTPLIVLSLHSNSASFQSCLLQSRGTLLKALSLNLVCHSPPCVPSHFTY